MTTEGIKTVLHPVSDLAAGKAVYSALLGLRPHVDAHDVGGSRLVATVTHPHGNVIGLLQDR